MLLRRLESITRSFGIINSIKSHLASLDCLLITSIFSSFRKLSCFLPRLLIGSLSYFSSFRKAVLIVVAWFLVWCFNYLLFHSWFVLLQLKPCQMLYTSRLVPYPRNISFTMVSPWIITRISLHR